MTGHLDTLLPDCVLPGCTTPVTVVGEACDGCRTAFGDQLRPTDAPALTAGQIAERDHATRSMYAHRGFP